MTVSASSGGVPAATNNARPISFRRSAAIFGILLPPSMGRAEIGPVDFQPVKASRIVKEDFALQLDRYVIAVGQGGNGIWELTVPVWIVRGEQNVVLGEEVRDIAQGLLFRFAGYEHAAACHVFGRLSLKERRVEGA